MPDSSVAVVRMLSSLERGPGVFRELIKLFVRETGTACAVSRRADERGTFELDRYVRDKAAFGDRAELLEAAFSDAAEERAAARERIAEAGWAAAFATEAGRNGAPLYELFVGSADERVTEAAAERLREWVALIEPLISARNQLFEQARTRDGALRELRTSEEALRRFFEDSKDMIYTTNAEDRFASVNDAGIALLGLENRFDAVGRTFSEFIEDPENRAYFLDRIRKNGFVRDYEYVITRPDGETLFCLETAHAIRKDDGSVSAVQGIVKDISERIKNEKELWKANLELADANERLRETQLAMVQQEKLASIGQLAAGVAHEINNPLGFMKSNFQIARDYTAALLRAWDAAKAVLPAETAARIEAAEDLPFIAEELPKIYGETGDGYARIIEIVAQLKSFARLDADAGRGPYDIEKGIESSLTIAWNEIKYVADVERDFGGVEPIEAEGGAVNQVILNILVNAAQAIASQGRKDRGRISVSTREDASFLYCRIGDDGPGMSEQVRRKAFDPFFTTKEPGKGTGLGLSISYDIIVNKHGGKLSVSSEPGKGCVFEIALPKAPAR